MPTQLVWFKRDLRLLDHKPLVQAAGRGPCLCVYVYEPELIHSPEYDGSHHVFINESLRELEIGLRARGGMLTLLHGRIPDVFADLHRVYPFEAIWAHEETGNKVTFARDLRLHEWCRSQGVAFHELPQNGVIRRLKNRDGWSGKWQQRMRGQPLPAPERIACVPDVKRGRSLDERDVGIEPSTKLGVQQGGESRALEVLRSFLHERGANYRKDMSSPVSGWDGCSRLSPYLAWGNISIRTVHRAAAERARELREQRKAGEKINGPWLSSLTSFQGRLRWHCHFMQKLEDEPRIEFENMNRAYDGLRENDFNEAYFDAWCSGQTGYPMVDACMRCLHQTGWINFRMRAMLASFAAYHLWLHWRRPAVFLARHFLDFEPGIHFSQFQMQSGVTGINTVRIYSPIKQVKDQDPTGVFIKRYCPELEGVPDEYLPEPHTMPPLVQQWAGCVIGKDYPSPIVDHKTAYQAARDRVYAFKRKPEVRAAAEKVYQKHGSRRRPMSRRT